MPDVWRAARRGAVDVQHVRHADRGARPAGRAAAARRTSSPTAASTACADAASVNAGITGEDLAGADRRRDRGRGGHRGGGDRAHPTGREEVRRTTDDSQSQPNCECVRIELADVDVLISVDNP